MMIPEIYSPSRRRSTASRRSCARILARRRFATDSNRGPSVWQGSEVGILEIENLADSGKRLQERACEQEECWSWESRLPPCFHEDSLGLPNAPGSESTLRFGDRSAGTEQCRGKPRDCDAPRQVVAAVPKRELVLEHDAELDCDKCSPMPRGRSGAGSRMLTRAAPAARPTCECRGRPRLYLRDGGKALRPESPHDLELERLRQRHGDLLQVSQTLRQTTLFSRRSGRDALALVTASARCDYNARSCETYRSLICSPARCSRFHRLRCMRRALRAPSA